MMHFGRIKLATMRIPIFIWAALCVRLGWVLLVPMVPVSDGIVYRDFANSIARGLGYAYPSGQLTVFWPVGTSAFYASIELLFGDSNWPIAIVNIIIGVAVVYLSYLLALRFFNKSIANWTAWLLALWPTLIQFTTVYASELLFMVLLLSALIAWSSKNIKLIFRSVLWGALLCAATFVRPTASPLFFLLPMLYYLECRDIRGSFVSGLVALTTAGVLFFPWVVRNEKVFGHYVLVSANFGSNLWMGNNPQSNGAYMPMPDLKFENEVARDLHFKELAVDFIKSNPVKYLQLTLRRVAHTYDRETIGIAWNQPALEQLAGKGSLPYFKLASSIYWWIVFGFALFGVGWSLWSGIIAIFNPLIVILSFFFIVPILTVGQDRYHLPLNPFFAVFAAVSIQVALRRNGVNRRT